MWAAHQKGLSRDGRRQGDGGALHHSSCVLDIFTEKVSSFVQCADGMFDGVQLALSLVDRVLVDGTHKAKYFSTLSLERA